jgi:hypothetical protein
MWQYKLTGSYLKINANKSELLVMECEGNTEVMMTDNNDIRQKQIPSNIWKLNYKNSSSLAAIKQKMYLTKKTYMFPLMFYWRDVKNKL